MQIISMKQLREQFEPIRKGISKGKEYLLLYRSKPLAVISPYREELKEQTLKNPQPVDSTLDTHSIKESVATVKIQNQATHQLATSTQFQAKTEPKQQVVATAAANLAQTQTSNQPQPFKKDIDQLIAQLQQLTHHPIQAADSSSQKSASNPLSPPSAKPQPAISNYQNTQSIATRDNLATVLKNKPQFTPVYSQHFAPPTVNSSQSDQPKAKKSALDQIGIKKMLRAGFQTEI